MTPANHRTAFDILDANGSIIKFQVEASNRLIFYFTLGGKTQYYYVPSGQEDILFGKDKILNVRLVTNGTNHTLLLNNISVWESTYTDTIPNWDNSSVLIIGAAGHKTYGHGYFSSDDLVDEFSISTGTAK